jgi:hypothetical protein
MVDLSALARSHDTCVPRACSLFSCSALAYRLHETRRSSVPRPATGRGRSAVETLARVPTGVKYVWGLRAQRAARARRSAFAGLKYGFTFIIHAMELERTRADKG